MRCNSAGSESTNQNAPGGILVSDADSPSAKTSGNCLVKVGRLAQVVAKPPAQQQHLVVNSEGLGRQAEQEHLPLLPEERKVGNRALW
jgi:hypothetical protein